MMPIRKLDINVANQIAAGEVIENPASVVKELVENSLDAGAKRIRVVLKEGGLEEITVIDDGEGIPSSELPLSIKRHATSKIFSLNDLKDIRTLGFRGEALPSIASVSKISVTSCCAGDEVGNYLYVEGGEEKEYREEPHPVGTKVTVKELFYNTPARKKFLKGSRAEATKVSQTLQLLALSRPDVSFTLNKESVNTLETPGDGNLFNTIIKIFGKDMAKQLIPIDYQEGEYSLQGYVTTPFYTWKNRKYQLFFVNNRYVRSQLMREALDESFKNLVTSKRYPAAFVFLHVKPANIDVNVHPTKIEVRFTQESSLRDFLKNAFYLAFSSADLIPSYGKTGGKYNGGAGKETAAERAVPDIKSSEGTKQKQERITISPPEGINDETSSSTSLNDQVLTNQERLNMREEAASYLDQTVKEEEPGSAEQELLYGTLLGQLFSTYILMQEEETLFLIDQHAAHERIIYEKMFFEEEDKKLYHQETLPLSLELPLPLAENIADKLDMLAELGLQLEQFGNNTFILRSVPVVIKEMINEETVRDILEDIPQNYPGKEGMKKEILQLISCKAAVKANQALAVEEMNLLLKRLRACENPYTCPHGRPVIFRLDKKEVEKFFKRRG